MFHGRFTVRTFAIFVRLVCAYFGAREVTKKYSIPELWKRNTTSDPRSMPTHRLALDEIGEQPVFCCKDFFSSGSHRIPGFPGYTCRVSITGQSLLATMGQRRRHINRETNYDHLYESYHCAESFDTDRSPRVGWFDQLRPRSLSRTSVNFAASLA
jgi:hypothetical protein